MRSYSIAAQLRDNLPFYADAAGTAIRAAARGAATRLGPVAARAMPLARAGLSAAAGRLRPSARADRPARPAAVSTAAGPKPAPRRIRRRWAAALEELGAPTVRDLLDTAAARGGSSDRVPIVDIGLIHGVHRFPTRRFVEDWLGGPSDAEADASHAVWRIRIALVTVAILLIALGQALI